MPKWICERCGCHFPGGIDDCPKCDDSYFGKITPAVSSLDKWIRSHKGHTFRSVDSETSENVLLKCNECNEYYLM